jgi:plasmid stabilization system protein ParE
MEEEKRIRYLSAAIESIFSISIHIENEGYPMTAQHFKKELFRFGNSLGKFPGRYPICRKPGFRKRNYRCAVYRKKYIFIYKPFKTEIVIYNVIHSSRYVF